MKLSGKTWLMKIPKVTKSQGFCLSVCLSLSRKHFFGKTIGERGTGANLAAPLTPAFLGLSDIFLWIKPFRLYVALGLPQSFTPGCHHKVPPQGPTLGSLLSVLDSNLRPRVQFLWYALNIQIFKVIYAVPLQQFSVLFIAKT